MSTAGNSIFDETLHTTNTWLKDLMDRLRTDDRHQAYMALRSVLHAIRDHLPVDLAAHLGAQLPMLVRGFYYEGWQPSHTPLKERHKEQFFAQIENEIRNPQLDPEDLTREVFALLSVKISEGEVRKVAQTMPAELREMWPP